ncbi:MAG: threonine synthase [Elusimicrobia bacterium RIFCSPHIGHO2_02_FULL_57_9]|nr:MAG: threonine synthase [Elusimicrobia bacterium RIFCSPHIGHO2_02_FULL_57_9]
MLNPALGIISRYRDRLPVTDKTPVVTLGEGATPLIRADRLAEYAGLPADSVYLKFEGSNPTGSFKDRGMAVAVSKALEEGARGVLCASTGNTAASAAAYAARAGLRCMVFLPKGGVALGKLAQALMHGAKIKEVKGSFDKALIAAFAEAKKSGFVAVNSSNPYRIEGQKTAAFEISEVLGRMPDYQFMPVGNAGNITAYWKGYRELKGSKPKMMGFQAAGAAPIVLGNPIPNPRTVASAIRIGNPYSWQAALRARDESNGVIAAVTDREILNAWRLLARLEGVFCEPSSAAGVAGLLKSGKKGHLSGKIVCILTGHGLKDPDTPLKIFKS